MMFAKFFNSFILRSDRQIFDLCVMMILLCVEIVLNLFKISNFMSWLNIGISIQVIITKFYVKYYLLVLHTSLCVITNSLLNTWTIHIIINFVHQKNFACVKWLKVKRLNDSINMKLPHALCSNVTKSFMLL